MTNTNKEKNKSMLWIVFAITAALSWGVYGAMLHRGQLELGNPLRALLCVGVAYFLIGRWLQRRLFGTRSRSQTVALLIGVLVLAFLSSLPVLGALLVFATFILSIGIILTMPVASAQGS